MLRRDKHGSGSSGRPGSFPCLCPSGSDVILYRVSSSLGISAAQCEFGRRGRWVRLQVALAAVLLIADFTSSEKALSCPCGSTGMNYTFRVSNTNEDCKSWSKCLKCQDKVDYCLECPDGLSGPTCSQRERRDLNECPDPGVPLYGVRIVLRPLNAPPFTRGSHLKFECVEGFYLEGWNSLVCLRGGKWSSPLPTCVTSTYIFNPQFKTTHQKPADDVLAFCSNPGPHFNGWVRVYKPIYDSQNVGIITEPPSISTPNEDQYPQETRLEYFCSDGYRTKAEQRTKINCGGTGLWSRKPPICIKDCGVINKWKPTKPIDKWPWMVGVASLSNKSSHKACGGVLLNDRTVLTAATCLLRNETFELLFGKYRSRPEDMEDGKLQRTNFTVQIHPDFNNSTHTADIALIQFSPSIAYSDDIQKICLPTYETKASNVALGRTGFVTSWRFTKDIKSPTPYLMSQQTVFPLRSCIKEYASNNLTLPMEPEMFCAQHSEAPSDNCSADGVSHMMFFGAWDGEIYNLVYTLQGLASFEHSSSCRRQGGYTIFTNLLPYVSWIEKNMS